MFRFWVTLTNSDPLVTPKSCKMVGSDHCLQNESFNALQSYCIHLLGEGSELIRFCGTLTQFRPSIAIKWLKNWRVPPIIGKTIHSIQLKLGVYSYLVSFQKWFDFGPHWPNFRLLLTPNCSKCWFLTIICKTNHSIHFILGVNTCWVSGPIWVLGQVGPISTL